MIKKHVKRMTPSSRRCRVTRSEAEGRMFAYANDRHMETPLLFDWQHVGLGYAWLTWGKP